MKPEDSIGQYAETKWIGSTKVDIRVELLAEPTAEDPFVLNLKAGKKLIFIYEHEDER